MGEGAAAFESAEFAVALGAEVAQTGMEFAWAVVCLGSAVVVVMGALLAAASAHGVWAAGDVEAVAVLGTGSAFGLGTWARIGAAFGLDIWVGAEVEIGLQSGPGIVFEDEFGFWVAVVFGLGSWVGAAFGLKAWVGLAFGLGIGVGVIVGLGPEVAVGVAVGLRSWTVVVFGLKAGFEVVVEAAVSAGSELVV